MFEVELEQKVGRIPLFTDTNAVTQIDFVATEITANAFLIFHFPFSVFTSILFSLDFCQFAN